MTEMIPISEIDSILKRYDRMSGIEFYGWDTYEDLIHELEELKQKAIPAIPISKIDILIKWFEYNKDKSFLSYEIISHLEDLKKGAPKDV